ncbi:MAG: polysaccharide pyruvyl transferase family protein [Lachnospirales bacterium]
MKIGILTHHYVNNFGAFLQAYSLMQAVKKLYPGDEVVIINYVYLKHFIANTIDWFKFDREKDSFKAWLNKIKLPKTFKIARENYLDLTKPCFTVKAVNELDFDYIIIGSDEVWNYKGRGNAKIKFGYGLTCKNLIAYGPSTGKTRYDDTVPNYVKEGIKSFKAISARDDLTEELVKSIRDIDVPRVLDPTFLSEFPRKEVKKVKKPYILFYCCDKMPENKKREIFDFAKENGLYVYGAGECSKAYSDITVNLTPFEWVNMFRNADYVVTGTFHGAVFSIVNRKKFICYLTNPSRLNKVSSLLKEVHLEDRRIIDSDDDFVKKLTSNINYSITNRIIDEKAYESKEFIRKNVARKY